MMVVSSQNMRIGMRNIEMVKVQNVVMKIV